MWGVMGWKWRRGFDVAHFIFVLMIFVLSFCFHQVYIGPQRYFVTSDVGDGRIQWYAFFALPPGTKRAPSGWGGSTRDEQADPEENLVDYIKSLHEGWSDEVMTVLDATPPDSVEQRDLYDRPPELLRSWADGNVVLMGDAVHPMMPNLGQVSFLSFLVCSTSAHFTSCFGILTLFHSFIYYAL
jgi:hypothetical protein